MCGMTEKASCSSEVQFSIPDTFKAQERFSEVGVFADHSENNFYIH